MKIIITEEQYGKLLSEEKIKVYTDEKEYKKSLAIYNNIIKDYKKQQSLINKMMGVKNMDYNTFRQWDNKIFSESSPTKYREEIKGKYKTNKFWTIGYCCKEKNNKRDETGRDCIFNPMFKIGKSIDELERWRNSRNCFKVYGTVFIPYIDEPFKPVFKKIIPPAPVEKPTISQITKQTPLTTEPVKPIQKNLPTEFSVTWRDWSVSTPNQKTHYFKTYEDWSNYVSRHDDYVNKSENAAKTSAEASYGRNLNLSIDKSY